MNISGRMKCLYEKGDLKCEHHFIDCVFVVWKLWKCLCKWLNSVKTVCKMCD